MDFVAPLLFALFVGVPVVVLSVRDLPRTTRERLLRHLLIAFGIRVTLAMLFATIPELRVFHLDAQGYEQHSLRLARYWSGDSLIDVRDLMEASRNSGTIYLFASLLYVFGPYVALISIFNSILGVLSASVVYRIGRTLFHEAVARRAAMCVCYFPSLIIWSAMALKDPFVGLAILVTTLFCIRLRARFSVANVVGVLAPIFAVYPVRFYIVYFLLASVIGTMLINRSGSFFSSLWKQVALVGGVLAIVSVVGATSNTRKDFEMLDLDHVSTYRHNMASSANSGFAENADVSTPLGALAFLPIGVTALLWSPFPWQMTSAHTLNTLPEMLFWWWCIPDLWRGVRFAVRKRFRLVSPILVFSALLLVGYALSMGNIGAAYRMRAQVLTLLFIFAALGHYLQIAKKKGIDEAVVLTR